MFSHVNRRTSPIISQTIPVTTPTGLMNFRLNRLIPPTSISTSTVPPPPPINDTKKKMIWGEPTWLFLHTIAQKAHEETFFIIRRDLLRYIYAICSNLPCPFCASHAKTYLDSVNFNTIQTKEELKNVMYTFHNVVNARKGYAMFKQEDLDAKYASAITVNIFNNFIRHFNDKHRAPGMIADDLFRSKLSIDITEWFRANSNYFAQ